MRMFRSEFRREDAARSFDSAKRNVMDSRRMEFSNDQRRFPSNQIQTVETDKREEFLRRSSRKDMFFNDRLEGEEVLIQLIKSRYREGAAINEMGGFRTDRFGIGQFHSDRPPIPGRYPAESADWSRPRERQDRWQGPSRERDRRFDRDREFERSMPRDYFRDEGYKM